MQAAEVFSQKHFPEVVQHEEFILLSQGEVEKLIKCDEIQVPVWLGDMLAWTIIKLARVELPVFM